MTQRINLIKSRSLKAADTYIFWICIVQGCGLETVRWWEKRQVWFTPWMDPNFQNCSNRVHVIACISFTILCYAKVSDFKNMLWDFSSMFIANYEKLKLRTKWYGMLCYAMVCYEILTKTPTCTEESQRFRSELIKSQSLPLICNVIIYSFLIQSF